MTAPTPRGVTAAEREGEPLTAEFEAALDRFEQAVVEVDKAVRRNADFGASAVAYQDARGALVKVRLAARREVETMRSAAQGALDTWSQHAEMAEEWSAIGILRAALATTPEERSHA